MAVDLGSLYWQSLEVQHGADAAALAGVVYEPDLRTEAHAEAVAAAAVNGFDDANPETTVSVIDFVDDDTAVGNDSMLRVTISHRVGTFFMKLLGLEDVTIQRTTVAEYVQPLPMGSQEATFGDDPATGNLYGYVAKVNGSYIAKAGGDRFDALCLTTGFGADCKEDTSSGSGGAQQGYNSEARQSSGWGTTAAQGGYVYGIQVPDGSSGLKVEIFNGAIYAVRKNKESPTPSTGTGNFLGDEKYKPCSASWCYNAKGTTWLMLYGPDLTPGDTTDGNELLCSIAYQERLSVTGDDTPSQSDAYAGDFAGWDNDWLEFSEVPQSILDAMWDDMNNPTIAGNESGDSVSAGCSSSFDKDPGTYLLRVFNQHDDSGATGVRTSWRGSNAYSLRASTTACDQPTISAIGDMYISASRNTAQTEFYLAKVEERYAGKSLVIELWDIGDIDPDGPNGDHFLVRDGNGDTVDCSWTATDTKSKTNPTSGGLGNAGSMPTTGSSTTN